MITDSEIDNNLKIKIALYFGITFEEIAGKSRDSDLVKIRVMIANYLFKEYGWDKSKTGRFLNRDHSTIFHGVNKLHPEYMDHKAYRTRYRGLVQFLEADLIRKFMDDVVFTYPHIKGYESYRQLKAVVG